MYYIYCLDLRALGLPDDNKGLMIIRPCAGTIHSSLGCPDAENTPNTRHYGNVPQIHLHDKYQTSANQQPCDSLH